MLEPEIVKPEEVQLQKLDFMKQLGFILPNMVPPPIPQRSWGMGWWQNHKRDRELERFRQDAIQEKEIWTNRLEMVEKTVKMVTALSTMSSNIQAVTAENMARVEIANQRIIKSKLENQKLFYEVEQERLAYENARKAQEEAYGSSTFENG